MNVHDFEDKELGKVGPYGVYDVTANAGFVSLGITSDTAEFAVEAIRTLAQANGPLALPEGARTDDHRRLRRLQRRARDGCGRSSCRSSPTRPDLTLQVHHYPPGTSKWNKIEHRLFCHITQNWRARPLTDRVARRRIDRRHHDENRSQGRMRP